MQFRLKPMKRKMMFIFVIGDGMFLVVEEIITQIVNTVKKREDRKMTQLKRGMITAMLIITASLLYMAGCGMPTDSSGESYNLYHGLEKVENAAPSVSIHQGEAVGRDAWFEFTIDNVDSEIMAPGVYDGWCMEWNKPIAQQGDIHENLQMYSTYDQHRWKPLNYFLNIKDELQAEDPSLTFREFQAIIWLISEGPEFNLNTLSNDELPSRLMKDGEPRFDKQKVQDIAGNIKAEANSFEYGPNTAYALFMKTGEDEQDIMVPVDPSIISHGYVGGVAPSNDPQFAERSYPVIMADWEGPGGDKRWLGRNLGATDAPESFDDDDKDRAGWFFQFNNSGANYWNGGVGPGEGFVIGEGSFIFPPQADRSEWLIENDPCRISFGGSWRVPTLEEWEAFYIAVAISGGMENGLSTEAFESALNLHEAGEISFGTGTPFFIFDKGGKYWTSTPFEPVELGVGTILAFSSDSSSVGDKAAINRGFSVRCIEG